MKIKNLNYLIDGILSIIIGAVLILMSIFAFGSLINITCIIIGIIIVLVNFYYVFISALILNNTESGKAVNVLEEKLKTFAYVELVLSLAGVILGFVFIFNHGLALQIVFGVYLIVYPIIRIAFALDKNAQFKKELPILLVALVIILLAVFGSLGSVLQIIAIIIGSLVLLSGIVSLIFYYKDEKKIEINNDENKVEEHSSADTIEVEAEEVKEDNNK